MQDFSAALFRDVGWNTVDLSKNVYSIVRRVLEYGGIGDRKLLSDHYGPALQSGIRLLDCEAVPAL